MNYLSLSCVRQFVFSNLYKRIYLILPSVCCFLCVSLWQIYPWMTLVGLFLYLFSVRCLSSCLSLVGRTLISEMFPPLYPTIKLASSEQNGPFISIEMDRIGTGTASLSACQPLSLPACQTVRLSDASLSVSQPVSLPAG